jgi:hypothetical protein
MPGMLLEEDKKKCLTASEIDAEIIDLYREMSNMRWADSSISEEIFRKFNITRK